MSSMGSETRKEELTNTVITLLREYQHPALEIGKATIYKIGALERERLYSFLTTPLRKMVTKVERPASPVVGNGLNGQTQQPYKSAMGEYIKSLGFQFRSPLDVSVSLLEAMANYVERNKESIWEKKNRGLEKL